MAAQPNPAETELDKILDRFLMYVDDPNVGSTARGREVAKQKLRAWGLKQVVTELSEARKWSTKAETADQVWQQLTDRIAALQAQLDQASTEKTDD